ncbi:MAG: esterase/lipase family protein [Geminicoccaceae bacterium]
MGSAPRDPSLRPERSRALSAGHLLLLHGLAREPGSLRRMAVALQAAGFDVANLSYPTRRRTLGALVEFVRARLAALEPPPGAEPVVHGVGHSLGGVVLRAHASDHGELAIGAIAGCGRFRLLVPAAWINARLGLIATTDGTIERDSAFGAPWLAPFADCIEVDCGHTLIATRPDTIRQTIAFLTRGEFEREPKWPRQPAD